MRVLTAVTCWVVVTSATGLATAGDKSEPMIVVVRVAGDGDRRLLARVEGQTSDLDVTIVVERATRMESSLPAQLATARRLADERGARVVIWFRTVTDGHGGRATIVHVAEPGADHILVRRVGQDGGGNRRLAGSAVAEAAALVVRSSLRALAAGGEIGVTTETAEAEAEAFGTGDDGSGGSDAGDDDGVVSGSGEPLVDDSASSGSGDDERLSDSDADIDVASIYPVDESEWSPVGDVVVYGAGGRRRLHVFAGLGWSSILDGDSDLGHHGASLAIGASGKRWRVGAAATLSPAVSRADALTSIELGRLQAELTLGMVVASRGRTRVIAELGAGVVRFSRSTIVRDPDVTATPASVIVGPVVSPAARLQLSIAGPLWLELVLGAEILGRAPEFGYEIDGMYVTRSSLWAVEPRAGLGLVVEGL